MSNVMIFRGISIAGMLLALCSGCQCCPMFDRYANVIDDVNDTHLYFDRCYNPRLDITRMGKPDWCSPFNNRFCKRCCNNGCYDRYDERNVYPPLNPYQFPSSVMPPPTIQTTRVPKASEMDDLAPVESRKPFSIPSPTPAGNQ